MTAAKYEALAAQAAETTGRVVAVTDLIRHKSWEPAARHYRDLTPEERAEQGQ